MINKKGFSAVFRYFPGILHPGTACINSSLSLRLLDIHMRIQKKLIVIKRCEPSRVQS